MKKFWADFAAKKKKTLKGKDGRKLWNNSVTLNRYWEKMRNYKKWKVNKTGQIFDAQYWKYWWMVMKFCKCNYMIVWIYIVNYKGVCCWIFKKNHLPIKYELMGLFWLIVHSFYTQWLQVGSIL